MIKTSFPSIYQFKSVIKTSYMKFLLIILFLAACTSTPKDEGTSLPPTLYQNPLTIPANPKGGYAINPVTGDSIQPLFNSLGDTITTGVPIPAQGKRIHPDSISKPKVVKIPAISSMERKMAHSNIYKIPGGIARFPVDQSKLTKKTVPSIEKGDTTHYLVNSIGQKVPTGVPINAKGKKVIATQPQPTQSLRLTMKDDAIANIQYLDEEQGLASSFITSMIEDKNGNLWFGADRGLIKYDGQSFIHFTKNEGLSLDWVTSIIEDKNGNLWIGTDGGGVSKYDGKFFNHFTQKEGLANNFVYSILEDKDGNLWFGTQGGVSKYDGRHFTHFTQKEGLSDYLVLSMVEDKNGNLWIGTDGGGVSKYDGKSFTHFTQEERLGDNFVYSILEDKSGNLWFGTRNGVSKYDGQSFTHFTQKEGLSNNLVYSILEDKSGNLWFGTEDGGVNKYDGNYLSAGQASFTHYKQKEGLNNNMVRSILEDKSGNLWFGTWGGGVCKYIVQSFTYFTEKQGLSNNSIYSFSEDKNGNLWFGTLGGGVSKYDGQSLPDGQASFTHFTEKEGLGGNDVSAIEEDKNGNLWFGTLGGGVSKYDGKSFNLFTRKEGLSNNVINSILEDKDGNLWFGTRRGVCKYDGKFFTHFTEKEGLSNNYVYSIEEDKNGHLWFGTLGGGVSKYDGKSFTHFTQKEGLINNMVTSIVEDKKGHLWFGTLGGVSKFDGKFFTHFTQKEGLTNNLVSSMVEDKNGHLWFGTLGGGVNKYNVKSLTAGQAAFTQITEKEGLRDNSVTLVVNDKDGNLWFGTSGWGVSKLDKNAFQTSPQPLTVFLRQLYINEALPNYHNPTDSIFRKITVDSVQAFENYPINPRIPFGQNHLGFQFSAMDWSAPTKIKYSFRLLGLDNKWSSPSEKTLADYRNLPDGKFLFQVRAIGESGKWSKSYDYFFTILPPWWKTWWATIIYSLLFLAALRTFSLWRERNLREEKEQLQQKVEERTIELKKSLEDLKSTQAQLIQSEKMASLGALTAGIAHEIQNPLNFVNNFSEVSNELIAELKVESSKVESERDKGLEDDLLNDIGQNLEKINHHSKRASDIVKGMLEHSRKSSGEKESIDINALCNEFLKLAYHGLRAKDRDFNVTLETHFDPNLPRINVIPQDISRVILNLTNNAFYVVSEKSKVEIQKHDSNYQPTVSITTQLTTNNQVQISIKDNGSGIPDAIKDKIFQPFFTTKPSGQGTGLGLSLSYDIVKAHGGTIEVESLTAGQADLEREGTTFILKLPIQNNKV